MERALQDQFISLFPTTLMKRRLTDMAEHNVELTALILELEEKQKDAVAGTSTKGGFQTTEDFLSREHTRSQGSIAALKKHIQEAVQEYSAILTRQECALAPRNLKYSIPPTWFRFEPPPKCVDATSHARTGLRSNRTSLRTVLWQSAGNSESKPRDCPKMHGLVPPLS